ncbi:hypothetical protein PENSPDRAFT_693590 [Peniophora sp. CONT]|nr:hypothetical protein PENSPDRAFT_693590 [Peniophora sp. CONT]
MDLDIPHQRAQLAQQLNALSPVHQLSPELLSQIFRQLPTRRKLAPVVYNHTTGIFNHHPSTILELSAVCTYWRRTIRHDRSLWTRVPMGNAAITEQYIELSDPMLLTCDLASRRQFTTDGMLRALEAAQRVQTLYLSARCTEGPISPYGSHSGAHFEVLEAALASQQFTNLCTLQVNGYSSFEFHSPPGRRSPITIDAETLVALRDLHMSWTTIRQEPAISLPPQLTSLKLIAVKVNGWTHVRDLLQLLHTLENLEVFEYAQLIDRERISTPGLDAQNLSSDAITHLNHLQTLSITGRTDMTLGLFSKLHFPTACTVLLNPFILTNAWTEADALATRVFEDRLHVQYPSAGAVFDSVEFRDHPSSLILRSKHPGLPSTWRFESPELYNTDNGLLKACLSAGPMQHVRSANVDPRIWFIRPDLYTSSLLREVRSLTFRGLEMAGSRDRDLNDTFDTDYYVYQANVHWLPDVLVTQHSLASLVLEDLDFNDVHEASAMRHAHVLDADNSLDEERTVLRDFWQAVATCVIERPVRLVVKRCAITKEMLLSTLGEDVVNDKVDWDGGVERVLF